MRISRQFLWQIHFYLYFFSLSSKNRSHSFVRSNDLNSKVAKLQWLIIKMTRRSGSKFRCELGGCTIFRCSNINLIEREEKTANIILVVSFLDHFSYIYCVALWSFGRICWYFYFFFFFLIFESKRHIFFDLHINCCDDRLNFLVLLFKILS